MTVIDNRADTPGHWNLPLVADVHNNSKNQAALNLLEGIPIAKETSGYVCLCVRMCETNCIKRLWREREKQILIEKDNKN